MDFNPCVDKAGFVVWKLARQQFSICNTEHGLVASMFDMDVWDVVLFVIDKVHADDNAVNMDRIGMSVSPAWIISRLVRVPKGDNMPVEYALSQADSRHDTICQVWHRPPRN